jgi:hypothetical protein
MNLFIYEAILTDDFDYKTECVCFPIRTEKSLEDLVLILNEKAKKYVELMTMNNIKLHEHENFFPFGDAMEFDLYACLDMSMQKNIFKLEDWKKRIHDLKRWKK